MIASFARLVAGDGRDLDRAVAAAVAQRVVEQVGEHPLEQAWVGLHERQVVGHVDLDCRAASGTARSAAPTTSSSATGCGCDADRAGLEPARVEQVGDDAVEPVGGVLDRGEQLVASSSDQSTSVWRRLLTAALMPASGVRRSWPTAASSAVRWRSTAASARAWRGLLGELAALVGGLRRAGERVQHALVLGEQRRAAADQPQLGPIGTSKRSGASSPGGRPADVLDVGPVARCRARATFSATDSMPNISRAWRSTLVQARSLVVVGAGERRERLGLRPRLLGGAGAPGGELDRAADDRRDGDEHDERHAPGRRARRRACAPARRRSS